MLYYAEATLEVDGGIQVTGSHNPPEYNGFKMVHAHAPFFGDDIQDLAALAASGAWSEGAGEVATADMLDAYVDRLMARLCRRRVPDRLGHRQRRRRPGRSRSSSSSCRVSIM